MRLDRTARSALTTLLAATASCASASGGTTAASQPERIVLVGKDQRELRMQPADANARATFAAPRDRVWDATRQSYGDAGILPTVADRTQGTYGNAGFIAPRSINNHPLRDYFNCGSGPSGALIDEGRLLATVMTTLTAGADAATTIADTRVTGVLKLNEGASTAATVCTSTGKLEEYLRTATERRLSATH